jgi:hypothetical protein
MFAAITQSGGAMTTSPSVATDLRADAERRWMD